MKDTGMYGADMGDDSFAAKLENQHIEKKLAELLKVNEQNLDD